MAKEYRLMPNEALIYQETNVAYSSMMSAYSDELWLSTENIIFFKKGVFGNTKYISRYPLNNIKVYKGIPQVMMGKFPNNHLTLDIYLLDGSVERFCFQSGNKRKIKLWIDTIVKLLVGEEEALTHVANYANEDNILEDLKDVGKELLSTFGIQFGKNEKSYQNNFLKEPDGILNSNERIVEQKTGEKPLSHKVEKISIKCFSCSAPLLGYKGKSIKCRYCDTEQVL